MHIINTLVPVFLLIGLGYALRASGFLAADFVRGINRLAYWVGLPALLFIEIATAEYDLAQATSTFLVILFSLVACVIAAYLAGTLLKLSGRSLGAFVQGAFRGNMVFIGLPVVAYSLADSPQLDAAGMTNVAVLALAMIIPIHGVGSVIILLAGQQKLDRHGQLRNVRQLVTNPFILACAAGLIPAVLAIELPWAIQRTFTSTGQMALPLALIATGASMTGRKIAMTKPAIWSSAIKVFLAPAVGLAIGRFMQLTPGQMNIALILLACPAAVSSFVLADQLKSDSALAADIVVISSLMSIPALAVAMALAS